jgi:hypothetical protein
MAGLLDIFGTSGADTMGLLGMSQADIARNRDDAQAQALYALAGRLFQGGNTGQSIVEGLQRGQQAYRGGMQETMQNQLQNFQLQDMLRKRKEDEARREQEKQMRLLAPQIFTTTTTPEQVTYDGVPSQFPARDDEGNLMPDMAIRPAQTTRSVDTNKLQALAMLSPDPLTSLASMAKLVPDLRKAGFIGASQQEDNPFAIYLADPNLPKNLKPIVQQYSKTWQNLDPAVVDTRVAQIGQMLQKDSDFKQVQARIEAQDKQLNAYKEQGLAQSAEAKALTASIAQGNQAIARMLAEQKIDAAKNKPLPASLQKSEDEDLQAINSYKATQKELFSPINALTPDPVTKKPMLVLGPVQNLRYEAANLTGDSTEASRAYADLQSSVKNAVNLKVSAEKGVQTDKDVLRFANALIAASGKNDTKATLEALKKFNDSIATAQENTVKLIEQRRKSQGVAPLFGDTSRNVNVNY